MNESIEVPSGLTETNGESLQSGGSTRRQLILASLFPLALFGFLSILVTASALYDLTLRLVLQRDLAQVQTVAGSLAVSAGVSNGRMQTELQSALTALKSESGSQFYLVDAHGNPLGGSEPGSQLGPIPLEMVHTATQSGQPGGQLVDLPNLRDQAIVSYAPVPGSGQVLIFMEPWSRIMNPAFYYQVLLAGLLLLGTVFSLYMLSLSLGRILRPISVLADNAGRAVPGSLFHPMAEQGPLEIRSLIRAFNLMVIRLAEQQTTLRQFAHKALLSQEEERLRLSHELHDGTVQDLVALSQRVELCRNELDHNPGQARRRLDELHALVERTLKDVRSISNALRPSILEDLGLAVALQTLCTDLETQMPSTRCEYTLIGIERRLFPDLELAIFRVVQEALANIRKHVPSATQVDVVLTFGNEDVETIIRNDGPLLEEPDIRSLVRTGHLGVAGMFERARLFHGTLEMNPGAERGSEVKLCFPYAPDPAGPEPEAG